LQACFTMCNRCRMANRIPLLTSAEVCAEFGIDRSTLVRWVASGKIAAEQKLPGDTGAYLFHPHEVARVKRTTGRGAA
jgi:predicted site-specific integrase-resolvase